MGSITSLGKDKHASFDNINKIAKDDLQVELQKDSRLSIAAACFLSTPTRISPTRRYFWTSVSVYRSGFHHWKLRRKKREFYIQLSRKNLYGTEFEVKLRNELSQKL